MSYSELTSDKKKVMFAYRARVDDTLAEIYCKSTQEYNGKALFEVQKVATVEEVYHKPIFISGPTLVTEIIAIKNDRKIELCFEVKANPVPDINQIFWTQRNNTNHLRLFKLHTLITY